jgi:rfaE bifunctional protein nucleotidyltransferase chain/domain
VFERHRRTWHPECQGRNRWQLRIGSVFSGLTRSSWILPLINLQAKILANDEVFRRFARPRAEKVVFTNGCFDILHRGHVEYLFAARSRGDLLIVGLNSDDSVRRLKGRSRPINSEQDRALVLAGLAAVDVVTVFQDDTPYRLISRLLPDLLVKGGDYSAAEVVGAREVEQSGGEVLIMPLVPGRSTTAILSRTHSDTERTD